MTIERIENGYLVDHTDTIGKTTTYCPCLEAVFALIMRRLEGRSDLFGAENYGAVKVSTTPGEPWVSPLPPPPA